MFFFLGRVLLFDANTTGITICIVQKNIDVSPLRMSRLSTQLMLIRDDLCWTEWVFLPNPAVTAQNQTNELVFGIVAGFVKKKAEMSAEGLALTL